MSFKHHRAQSAPKCAKYVCFHFLKTQSCTTAPPRAFKIFCIHYIHPTPNTFNFCSRWSFEFQNKIRELQLAGKVTRHCRVTKPHFAGACSVVSYIRIVEHLMFFLVKQTVKPTCRHRSVKKIVRQHGAWCCWKTICAKVRKKRVFPLFANAKLHHCTTKGIQNILHSLYTSNAEYFLLLFPMVIWISK